jgi:hypothetical protein
VPPKTTRRPCQLKNEVRILSEEKSTIFNVIMIIPNNRPKMVADLLIHLIDYPPSPVVW